MPHDDQAAFDQSVSPFGVRIPFAEHLGIRLVSATKTLSMIALDREPHLVNSMGATHGGVLLTMLDLVMTIAVRAHFGVAGGVITIDMNTSFIAPSNGTVFAEGRVSHAGRSLCFCEGEARDEQGTLLAKSMGTFRLVEKKPAA